MATVSIGAFLILRVSGARPEPLLELAKMHIEDDFPKVADWVHVTGNS